MRKCDKKRLKRIRQDQKVQRCKSRLRARLISVAVGNNVMPHTPTIEVILQVVQLTPLKELKIIESNQSRFQNFPMREHLFRLVVDEIALRSLRIDHE